MRGNSTETVAPGSVAVFGEWLRIPAGTRINDRYEVGAFLGSGGSAVVYAAFDHLLARPVALKVLRADRSNEAAASRLRREVALAGQISSEHVVRLYELGESAHGLFITMELVDGESLRDRIARAPLSVDETITLAVAILEGLAAIHRAGVVHRDVKPSNVLIGSEGVVKLTDLGLARTFESDETRITRTDAVVGTMEYLSPEQALAQPIDSRSDLYSFGVLLFECLTGELPYGERSSVGAILAHVRERPRDVRAIRPEISRWLALIIRKLLEKNPARRYQSVAEVSRALTTRKAPVAWRTIAAAAALATTITVAAVGARWAMDSDADSVRIVTHGQDAFRVVDASGRVLWTRDGVDATFTTLLRSRNGDHLVAVFPVGYRHVGPAERSKLLLLDWRTGRTVKTATLPTADSFFPSFAREFGARELNAVDVDHDGSEELVIAFVHVYYPSYSVYYDPWREEARVALLASGHQRLVATTDVTGDGRDELLIGGINNKLGWYMALAAVKVPARSQVNAHVSELSAATPDRADSISFRGVLAWYTLLPPGYNFGKPVIDHARRTIALEFGERIVRVDFDGFIVDGKPRAPLAERIAARAATYAHLRDATALARGGYYEAALAASAEAEADSSRSADPYLSEWVRRYRTTALVQAGKGDEAIALVESGAFRREIVADVRYDVAKELHLRGELEKAIVQYRRGAYEKSTISSGRLQSEFTEGLVFALCELGRTGEADAVAADHREVGASSNSLVYRNYVRLLTGREFVDTEGVYMTDIARYLVLENAARERGDQRALLARVEAELQRVTEMQAGLQSLAGELHRQLGDQAGAQRYARAAVDTIKAQRPTSTFARAHAPFVFARARAAGVPAS